jgi:hypothetical protein
MSLASGPLENIPLNFVPEIWLQCLLGMRRQILGCVSSQVKP